jgi:hypothetical protein
MALSALEWFGNVDYSAKRTRFFRRVWGDGIQFRGDNGCNQIGGLGMTIQQQPQILPTFTPATAMRMYLDRQVDALCEYFLAVLGYYNQSTTLNISPPDLKFLNEFVKTFLYLFSQEDFIVPDKYLASFVEMNHVISNVVAMSSFKTTDAHMENHQFNFARVLTLYSARNKIQIDARVLFELNGQLASLWYCKYASAFYSGLVSKTVCDNLKRHYQFEHPNFLPLADVQELSFGSTYLDGESDRIIKHKVNKAIQQNLASWQPKLGSSNPRKVGVISAFWVPNHSVYRILHAYIQSLKPDYHLTFYQLGTNAPPNDGTFDVVQRISLDKGAASVQGFAGNDLAAVIYPDVGMSAESVMLSNLRLAPLQIACLGHSVSTYGADLDYYISGADVDSYEHPERNYSERLVLLPGMGAIHDRPRYSPRGVRKQSDEILINCSWFAQKINYVFVQTIRTLLDRLKRKVKLRLFLGHSSSRKNDHLPFALELLTQLGQDRVDIFAGLGYEEYMSVMEQGDLSIESYHFGGCNTVSDSLFLGIPMVTWQGERWYNRIGSQMLRLTGLGELIAENAEHYISLVARMVEDDEYRQQMRDKIAAADLNATIYDQSDAKYFKLAIDYLIANHNRLKSEESRIPIVIGRT